MRPNFLVIATFFKGERFLRRAHAEGANVYLYTAERLLGANWPREILENVFAQRENATREETIRTVSYIARTLKIDRIVALDDFDVETGAALREHLRVPGMGDTTARYFRDKLAMRVKAREAGIAVPEFVHVLNYDTVREFCRRVPAPWMNKPRWQASASGITKVHGEAEVFALADKQGDDQSNFVLEAYVPGDVYHVDSIVSERQVVFTEAHRCLTPPFDVAHGGGIYASHTVERGSEDERQLRAMNEKLLHTLGFVRGVTHVEFIKGRNDGRFYMLECAARVGGAHIADLVEASTGVNLWEEWAKLEVDEAKGQKYMHPTGRSEYGGLVLTLAKEKHPDTSSFDAPEVVYRSPEEHHAGLIVRCETYPRALDLVQRYADRLKTEFMASMPALDKPTR
jgi:hypothetical protein